MRIGNRYRGMAVVNAVLALFLAFVAAWSIRTAQLAAEDAVHTYGYNVDSGAILWLFAYLVAPSAFAFGLAFIGFWRGLQIRWFLQCAPIVWCAFAIACLEYQRPFELFFPALFGLLLSLAAAFLIAAFGDRLRQTLRHRRHEQ